MGEIQKDGFPEHYDLLPHPLKRVGKMVLGFFNMHQLASHGDHTFEHPLDSPIEPVTDWPPNQMVFEYEDGTN